ncbi:hypothetical protein [Pseudaestuariivita rosea]|uniref:hypothetical protein n=1 Tax=Pseudaestuariivita rosea TaxID=2763263 RepID=UPI001ABAA768|nr:hypothetical protein [Pseudaestuariivita rosea]
MKLRGWGRAGGRLQLAFVAMLLLASACLAEKPLIIGNDPGGNLEQRALEIRQLRAGGRPVRITGRYCMSACTLYLGLPKTCVSPHTIFGFHGPRSGIYGVGLPPPDFEKWSRLMARHYPAEVREWYLEKGRYMTMGFYELRGRDLIKLGVPRCRL